MSLWKKALLGCALTPVVLIASCFGKVEYDNRMYDLPGATLASSLKPTQSLDSAERVAEELDAYVQPRFEILRDKNFGAFRITYRQHAGLNQLKVDTQEEKQRIANINATNRDYAISLLHCAPIPEHDGKQIAPSLQTLYFNQERLVSDSGYPSEETEKDVAKKNGLDLDTVKNRAIDGLPQLMNGKEYRSEKADWTMLMRPTLAKQECLSCHKGAKSGDTLGVMVYAVRKTPRNEAKKISWKF